MSRILLIGGNGQVGWELQRTLAPLGEVIAARRERLDVANTASIRQVIREEKPQIIVNATAYTAVDKAESEPELARQINGTAPGIMAEEAEQLGALLVHYSTDYVFDGDKQDAYTEEDTPNPLSVYGKTKLAGEQAIQATGAMHLILRTSWVYGVRGKNFLRTIMRLAKERDELKIVDDQHGAPTWSRMIAEATAQILNQMNSPLVSQPLALTELSGTYHLTAAGQTTWHGFAKAILEHSSSLTLRPIPAKDYPLPAPRPRNSVMSNEKLKRTFGISMPHWDEVLRLCLEDMHQ